MRIIIDAGIREALTALSDFKMYVASIRKKRSEVKEEKRLGARAQDV